MFILSGCVYFVDKLTGAGNILLVCAYTISDVMGPWSQLQH